MSGVNFEGPKPEVIKIPIRPVRRDGELVPVEELDDSEVYRIRVGMLRLREARDVEALILQKMGSLVPAFMAAKTSGQLDFGKLGHLIGSDDLERLAKVLGPVCEVYNGVSETSGTERWMPMNEENQARMFGGGRMLAFNRWILEALHANFADFFDGLGLGGTSKLGALLGVGAAKGR